MFNARFLPADVAMDVGRMGLAGVGEGKERCARIAPHTNRVPFTQTQNSL
jgi:hypothetical protein